MIVTIILAGLAVGSFLNVCIDRLPAGQSPLSPRSHCDACSTPLASRDLIPVLSYLLLRGRCRHCSAAISMRVPLVEAATGLLFYICWWRFDTLWQAVAAAASACVLIAVSVITVENSPLRPSRRTYK
jgi:leader peptidase (prepilin peptidase) / N-methyltransferase